MAIPYEVGTPVSETKLIELRDCVIATVKRLESSRTSNTRRSDWDLAVGTALYRTMEIIPSDASHEGPWAFLTLVLLPDFAVMRFPDRHPARMLGGRRNVFRRVWWRQHILGDLSTREGVRPLGEDEMVNIFERSKMARNHNLARELARAILDYPGDNRSEFTRRLTRRVRALTGPIMLDVCSSSQLRAVVDEAVAFESDLPDLPDQSSILSQGGDTSSEEPISKEENHDWNSIVQTLNQSDEREIRITMGTPGSAQVTRVRLMKKWDHLTARTEGSVLILGLDSGS